MKQLMITQIIQTLKNQELLLVLDNCDLIVNSGEKGDKEVFTDFVEIILSNCNKVHILLTCRSEVIVNY
jgi:predicted site-specific integrase-resolvase